MAVKWVARFYLVLVVVRLVVPCVEAGDWQHCQNVSPLRCSVGDSRNGGSKYRYDIADYESRWNRDQYMYVYGYGGPFKYNRLYPSFKSCYDCAGNGSVSGSSVTGEVQTVTLSPSQQDITILVIADNNVGTMTKADATAISKLPCGKYCSLWLVNCNITTIEVGAFAKLSQVETLIIWQSNLQTLRSGTFEGMEGLEKLLLLGNNITCLEAGAFDGLPLLRSLYLVDNQILTMAPGMLRGLQLDWLDVSANSLWYIAPGVLQGTRSVRNVYIVKNKLQSVSVGMFAELANMQSLYLQYNEISRIADGAFHSNKRLGVLNLACNKLTFLSGLWFKSAEIFKLYLKGNAIAAAYPGRGELRWDVRLQDNPLRCTCANIGLYEQLWKRWKASRRRPRHSEMSLPTGCPASSLVESPPVQVNVSALPCPAPFVEILSIEQNHESREYKVVGNVYWEDLPQVSWDFANGSEHSMNIMYNTNTTTHANLAIGNLTVRVGTYLRAEGPNDSVISPYAEGRFEDHDSLDGSDICPYAVGRIEDHASLDGSESVISPYAEGRFEDHDSLRDTDSSASSEIVPYGQGALNAAYEERRYENTGTETSNVSDQNCYQHPSTPPNPGATQSSAYQQRSSYENTGAETSNNSDQNCYQHPSLLPDPGATQSSAYQQRSSYENTGTETSNNVRPKLLPAPFDPSDPGATQSSAYQQQCSYENTSTEKSRMSEQNCYLHPSTLPDPGATQPFASDHGSPSPLPNSDRSEATCSTASSLPEAAADGPHAATPKETETPGPGESVQDDSGSEQGGSEEGNARVRRADNDTKTDDPKTDDAKADDGLIRKTGCVDPKTGDQWGSFDQASNKCYKAFRIAKTWPEASAHCRNQGPGGNLAMPKNSDTNKLLIQLKEKISSPEIWFGLNDRVSEGQWKWNDGTSLVSYNDWSPHEPSNGGGHGWWWWNRGNEDCAEYNRQNGWNDNDCAKRRNFICEREPNVDFEQPKDIFDINEEAGLLGRACPGFKCDKKDCNFGYDTDEDGCFVCSCVPEGREVMYQGDIVLDRAGKNRILHGSENRGARIGGLWPGGVVPYHIEEPLRGSNLAVNAINDAITDYHKYTCLRFIRRTNQTAYISFVDGLGCSSPVGYYGRVNRITLSSVCWTRGTVIHEIAHSVGFWHEQSRPDRDDFVEIVWDNIPVANRHNFNLKENVNSLGSPYDYQSIMHYKSTAFGLNRRVTIRTTDASQQDKIGQREGLSERDITQLNLRYNCGYLQKITFPAPRSISNYARLEATLAQDLRSLTLCLHMRTDMSSTSSAGVVSYAVQGQYNELLILNERGLSAFWVRGTRARLFKLPVWDGARHAVCATWRSTDGAWQVYTDGVLKASGAGLNVGGKVRSGGTWILAQDQDTVGGGFVTHQAFSGELSQVNLWDRVLTPAEIGTDCISNYARLEATLAQDLRSLTLCLHMRTDMSSTSSAGVVSYAVQGQYNELLILNKPAGSEFWVQGSAASPVNLPVWDGERHAVCVTWRSTDGAWQVYTDGVLKASGSGLNVGGKVRSGGTWILAQDQDTVGGGFVTHQAFSGELSQVNLWDRVLTPAEIGTDWSDFCGQHGNVIDWETSDINVYGRASSAEYRCSYLQKITFPAPRSISNYARLEATLAQDLRSLTLCLHMRTDMSSTSSAGVVSYAVQGQYNELLILNKPAGSEFWVQGSAASPVNLPVWDGERHAVCATWRSTDGAWQVYTDGVIRASGSGLNVGGKVRSGGTWILAQYQDTVGGGFVTHQAFSGELSQVNLWDRVLTPAEIGTDWSDFCGQHGNVIDWETSDINVYGRASSAEYRCSYLQKITFPAPRSISNYARLEATLAQDLRSLTLCLHMRTDMSSTSSAGVVSYAVQGQYNELLIINERGLSAFWVRGNRAFVNLPVWDGERHAVCATWRSTDGAWQVYSDGVLRASGSGLNVGRLVRSGGTWILAQDQDTVGGGFKTIKAFSGELSQVNLWDRVLTPAEIGTDWSDFCVGQHGNVIDWETSDINVYGRASSAEYRCSYLQKITFPAPRSISNYARLEATLAQDLRSLTLCLHMRTDMSSTSSAGVVSYAVQGQYNELLILNKPAGSEFWVQGSAASPVNLPVWDGERHAVCVTWRSTDGAWQVYTDGVLKASGSGLNVGGKVRSGGTWILAQDQDTVGGGFVTHQAFSGELSQVNLWDRVLTPAEIGTDWSDFCGQHGNVIDWETSDINVYGRASSAEYRCKCTDGYTRYKEVCYKVIKESKTHHEASTFCSRQGPSGRLAMAKDRGTNDFLIGLKNGACNNCQYHFGLTDTATEGQWKWADGSALGLFKDWASGEPNNGRGGWWGGRFSEDCAEFKKGSGGGEWNDVRCSKKQFFICEV
uniref:Metalloendopeptidase n=1 Tax=Branchiostoma floridae TaxID=7739 RepID=C3YSP6_BRAFL|eukprot:XP_002600735.1 hypothetical protein BRAFLDRAFT_83478 [Branchiostoma floridae]